MSDVALYARAHLLDEIKADEAWWPAWKHDAAKRLASYDLDTFLDRDVPYERVAFLTGKGRVPEISNYHPDQFDRFTIYVRQLRIIRKDDWLWAVMHTHPRDFPPEPSEDDLSLIPLGLLGVVVHVATGTRVLYRQHEVILSVAGEANHD